MTPALSLYLLAAARAEPLMARQRQDVRSCVPERAPGQVVWIHLGSDEPGESVGGLAGRIADERPEVGFVVTSDAPDEPGDDLAWVPRPFDFPQSVEAFLAAWAPSACVWIGGPLWPVLAAKAQRAGIPMLLVNATKALAAGHRGVPARDLLGLFDRIAARGDLDRRALERAARRPVEVIGKLQRSTQPLDHDEAERHRISTALQSRPVWFAAGATTEEAEALRTAHIMGQGGSHRLLLIVQPADADAAAHFRDMYGAHRSRDGVPPPGAPALVADLPREEGLWFRLASVSFIGGTLGGPVANADPLAAAALGSAVVHGPLLAPFASHFAALAGANASRQIADAEELGRAVADLLAPDRTAELAHRAWSVVSEGAEATDHVAEAVGRILDGAK